MRLCRFGAATRNEPDPQGRVTASPAGDRRIMETRAPIPRAILVGVQVAGVDDVAHAASIEELGLLVKTLGCEVVSTISQKRDEMDGATVIGCGDVWSSDRRPPPSLMTLPQQLVQTRHETDTPHQRISPFAKPNGAGVNGPGGARLINATKNSATIASQKDSQKPSM
jgi:hypothetical protein